MDAIMDTGMVVLFLSLAIFVALNRSRIAEVKDILRDIANNTHIGDTFRVFKRKTTLEIQLLKNRIDELDELEKVRSSQTTQ